MSSDPVKVLCYCLGRCGGPDGTGKLWSQGTVYKHKKFDRDAVEAARHAAAGHSTNLPSLSNSRARLHTPTDGAVARDDRDVGIRMSFDEHDPGAEQNPDGPLHREGEMVRLFLVKHGLD